ncbi:membrane protein insertion efficiency factor YidD [Desulfobacter hydrogenophilus]|uniref:Membrane protein insertion efficiency factor YidD n=1 Tax=Desulfobacter hydrogenophilus TaxID=2291 RepID=A0A328FC99_9BACT|nr:membrane protein insertion efficiency factor YidD [Desulfobacter hydrogenophilus]QBH14822.1 membrane protein insertion efficiency factor YidD [Desulfobacter hydrogenophilus]RAM01330.1 membrane protein insertion efficiency factor YidD [Desulfobacter hydrogenophilus]
MMLNSNTQRILCDISLKTSIILLFFFIFMLSALPKEIWAQDPTKNNRIDTNPIIQVYQAHISGIDGNRCPMYPHCSQYCAQAIRKHGFGLGWIMACDRLLRCGRDEVQLSPHVRMNGRELIFDPVSANDFWWFSPKPPAKETNLPGKKMFHSDSGRMSDVNPDQHK